MLRTKIKIDLVYLWVDASDVKYRKLHAKYLNNVFSHQNRQFCELMYSLRSVERNLPWINNIFIITDKQIPPFINLNNKKIRIIDHTDIMPKENLPVFNASAIEVCIGNIKELSEFFLYANDDMFIGRNLSPEYFFDENNKPILYMSCSHFRHPITEYHLRTFMFNYEFFNKHSNWWLPSHNVRAFRKSYFNSVVKQSKYKNFFEATKKMRYRSVYDLTICTISLMMAAQDKSTIRKIPWFKQMFVSLRYFWFLKIFKPDLFCINDTINSKTKKIHKVQKFLEKKYSKKSIYEK